MAGWESRPTGRWKGIGDASFGFIHVVHSAKDASWRWRDGNPALRSATIKLVDFYRQIEKEDEASNCGYFYHWEIIINGRSTYIFPMF